MEYIYAALLLHKLKKDITTENIVKIMKAVGVEPDEIRAKALIAALGEVKIDDVLKNAAIAPVPAQPLAPAVAAAAPEAAPEKPAKEEKKEEALEGLSSLFG